MRDGSFEWDEVKAAANLVTHGVSFEVARLAFTDVFAVTREDLRQDYGEDRYTLLGMVDKSTPARELHNAWRAHPDHFRKIG